jgi:transcriptional regulator of heat shock response
MFFFDDEDPTLWNPYCGEGPTQENYEDYMEQLMQWEDDKRIKEEYWDTELEEQVSKIIQRWWRRVLHK